MRPLWWVPGGLASSFLVIGDVGCSGEGYEELQANVRAMHRRAEQHPPEFVLVPGDNFYTHGVSSEEDPQWEKILAPFLQGPALDVPLYAALGNHDWLGDPAAQVQRHYRGGRPRWVMPHYWYTAEHEVEGGRLLVVVLDTQILAPEETWDAKDRLPSSEQRDRQLDWFSTVLAQATQEWIIVVGHYPIYSRGPDRALDSRILARDIKPLMDQHGVDLYVSGHDHLLQRFEDDGLVSIVAGSGCKLSHVLPYAAPQMVWGEVTHGFAEATVVGDEMTVGWFSSNGTQLRQDAHRRKPKRRYTVEKPMGSADHWGAQQRPWTGMEAVIGMALSFALGAVLEKKLFLLRS
mmetsp:Transcript_87004/g.198594  ORF Transcript_87004/g.198594 Transcript_87004/m.198594 type:complete len:348 (-) Transcript_87004:21-1064(-)